VIKFARKITNLHAGKKLAEITVKGIKVNSGLKPEDLAMKPSDLKPVMSYSPRECSCSIQCSIHAGGLLSAHAANPRFGRLSDDLDVCVTCVDEKLAMFID
jgi:hypothetical protein